MVHIIPLGHHAGHTGLCACCPSRLHLVVAQRLVRGTSVQPVHSTYTSWSKPNTDGAHSGYPAVAHIFPAIRDGLYEAWIWWPSQNKPVNIFLMYLGPLSTKTAKKSDPIKKNDTSRLFFGRSGAISVKNWWNLQFHLILYTRNLF